METTALSFKECTLHKLDKTFGLKQSRNSTILDNWLNRQVDIPDFEKQALQRFKELLILNVHDWNETELIQNFIGPIFALVNYTTDFHQTFFKTLNALNTTDLPYYYNIPEAGLENMSLRQLLTWIYAHYVLEKQAMRIMKIAA
jgi:hypothetical protein